MKFIVQQQPVYVYTGGKDFDAAKPSVVFIHGAANDHSVWTMQARYFAHHGWNVLAPDLPGHGRSFGDAKTSITAYSEWIIDLLDNGGIEKAAIVGQSMGSLIALEVSVFNPSRVSQLALIGACAPMPVSDALMEAAIHRPAEAFDMLNIWGHAPQLRWGKNPTPGTSSMMAYKRLVEQSRPGVLVKDLAACRDYQIDEIRLKENLTRTLVVAGAYDLLTPPKAAAALAAQLGDGTLVTIADAGHAMMQEAPGKVIDVLKAFLKP